MKFGLLDKFPAPLEVDRQLYKFHNEFSSTSCPAFPASLEVDRQLNRASNGKWVPKIPGLFPATFEVDRQLYGGIGYGVFISAGAFPAPLEVDRQLYIDKLKNRK